MSGDSSEEKSLPPSHRKLQDARKKGQIAKSADLVSAAAMLAAAAILWSRMPAIRQEWNDVLMSTPELAAKPFDVAMPQILVMLAQAVAQTILPVLGAITVAAVMASVIGNGGMVFSFEPLMPKFSNLNVIQGLGRIFGMRGIIEFFKTLAKAAVIAVALGIVIMGTLNGLVRLPSCGQACVGPVFGSMAGHLIAIAGALFVLAGMVDVLLQRWLFTRDMRMTQTEAKREHKDQDGDPHIKSAHRRHRMEASHAPKLGMGQATILILGRETAVALRYIDGQSRAPTVVARAKSAGAAADLRAQAQALNVPIAHDQDRLARQLARRVQLGQPIPSRHFQAVARAFYAAAAVR